MKLNQSPDLLLKRSLLMASCRGTGGDGNFITKLMRISELFCKNLHYSACWDARLENIGSPLLNNYIRAAEQHRGGGAGGARLWARGAFSMVADRRGN